MAASNSSGERPQETSTSHPFSRRSATACVRYRFGNQHLLCHEGSLFLMKNHVRPARPRPMRAPRGQPAASRHAVPPAQVPPDGGRRPAGMGFAHWRAPARGARVHPVYDRTKPPGYKAGRQRNRRIHQTFGGPPQACARSNSFMKATSASTPGFRHGVVDARAHAAHAAVALEVLEARLLRLGDEFRVQVGVARDERHVHERAVLLAHGAAEQRAFVQEAVEQRRLLAVALLHGRKAALALDPLEHLAADVDAVGGRRIVQRVRVGPASSISAWWACLPAHRP